MRESAIKCLTVIGGIYNRKMYIPGQTRENEEARKNLIEGGGLMALIYINEKCDEKEIKAETSEFLDNLALNDYEF